jgi:hypothetical protein
MRLGFNLSILNKTVEAVKQEITEYSEVSTDAIELSLTKAKGILEFPFEEIYGELSKFKYISIHLPVISGLDPENREFLKYPDPNLAPVINKIKEIPHKILINSFVLHPDQVSDFDWAEKEFGAILGFENMDSLKEYGKTLMQMEEVFKKCPKAKWIFDINHLYTNDATMDSAQTFYNKFKERLTHYHISAYGGFHSSFNKNPQELIILKGIFDNEHPLIHEGYEFEDHSAKEEYDLISRTIEAK